MTAGTDRERRGPLAGTRVVEFAGVGPAPYACMLLADMGAEIVTILPPKGKGAAGPLAFGTDPMMRGRSAIELDVKTEAGRMAALAIVAAAELLAEGFRPGVMERLGLGPDVCLARNPKLVYGRMTGWGQDGPLAHGAGHDPNYLSLTGALFSIGEAGGPPVPPLNLVGDFGGGGAFLAIGLLAALVSARATGVGQVVDAAMVDGAASLMTAAYGMRNAGLWTDRRGSNLIDGGAPFGACYATSDGGHMAVCAIEPKFYSSFVAGLGLAEADLPQRMDQRNWPALRALFAERFAERTRAAWTAVFDGREACVTPVLDMGEAPSHPHLRARGTFVAHEGGLVPAAAPRFSATPSAVRPQAGPPVAERLAGWGVALDGI
jgi:alpha-methylacyl-CoA racemase